MNAPTPVRHCPGCPFPPPKDADWEEVLCSVHQQVADEIRLAPHADLFADY